jgi:hypothetical protein
MLNKRNDMKPSDLVGRITEANRISGTRAYGDCEYKEEDPRMAIWRLEAEYIVRKAKEEQDANKTTNK